MRPGTTYRLGPTAREHAPWAQALRFGLVGGTGYLINLGVFALLTANLGVQHTLAAVAAFCIAVTNNFFWNRRWTFGPGDGPVQLEAVRFLVVSLGSLMLNIGMLELLVQSGLTQLAAQALAVGFAMPFTFLANRFWTFK
jgi:dolichol-phosphate mannosyltransferase